MKLKPIYIYIIVFAAFIVGIILFSGTEKGNDTSNNNMPNDDIHKGLQNEGDTPSKGNVMESAVLKLEELKKAYEKDPNDTLKIREYADMLTMAHKPQEAIALYHKILKVDSKRIDVLLQLTFLHYNNGDLPLAEETTNTILRIDRSSKLASYNLGAIEAAKGNKAKAKEIWESVIKKFPNTTVANIAEQSIKQLDSSNPK
ncbi:MAG: tetratricopeptide repeat protein [Bacteroidota bacterium]